MEPGGSPYVQGESPKRLRRFVEAVITPGSLLPKKGAELAPSSVQPGGSERHEDVAAPKRWTETLKLYRAMLKQREPARSDTKAKLDKLIGRLGNMSLEQWGALFAGCPRAVQRKFMVYVVRSWADAYAGVLRGR